MAVTNNFQANTLDLDGKIGLVQPTALVWGPDGRLYVTEVDGGVKVLTIAFGDKPGDGVSTAKFYVTAATTVPLVKGAIQNHNDNGTANAGANRQVTGIDVTPQFDAAGNPMKLANGTSMVTMYVTSSDSRIGAGGSGADAGLDTNSGVITKLIQTGANSWTAIDIVRGLPRSEENHATNGLEVIQEIGPDGKLISERMIVAQGGNANSGAPSYNFAGQQEQPLSGAILEVNLDMLRAMPVKSDGGRAYIYDLPTLNDPTRTGSLDAGDPFGGNDGLNSAVLASGGPVKIYSAGYRNSYDVEVTDDGRVWTYDNGANNSWGGRPIGEAGDNGGAIDLAQALGYISTNLNNGEGNANDGVNLVNWNPANKDNFHEVTRSDDLAGRTLSAGQGGAQTYVQEGLVHVYGGHPNPTRAEGSRAGMLFTPGAGTDNAFLLVSNQDSFGNGGGSDYAEVIGWLTAVENNNAAFPSNGIYGATAGALTKKVLAVTPGVAYDIYALAGGAGAAVVKGGPAPAGGVFLGSSGLPADIASIVPTKNPIEGNYKEGGKTDGALDSGNGSINGLTEYTSTILDDGATKMKGAIIAANLNGGSLIVMGRNADGSMASIVQNGFAVAADRTTLKAGGGPLGLTSLGDDVAARGLEKAFQGSIWVATYNQNGPLIEVFQPANGKVPLAGQQVVNTTDHDLDGVGHIADPFEFSSTNGYAIAPGQSIVIDFNPQNTNFPTSIAGTGLLGAALDGVTPNRDAQTAFENYPPSQQLSGLYDIGGNVLPGGNAPILQIKKVTPGSVVGAADTARDVLHTGIKPSADVGQIVATMTAKNWVPAAGGVKVGQLTGMIFGDGTQANFLRLVFGSVNGVAGIEVGYELGNVNYTKLATIATPGLSSATVSLIDLKLTLDSKTFAVATAYKLEGQAGFTPIDLKGFVLPPGILRDVLTGAHTIGTAPAKASGAAIGFLAETSQGNPLEAVDFYSLKIEAFGNQILATTGAQVGASGSAGIDTVNYTGSDAALAPLATNVENFDGAGSAANYAVTGNALGNVIKVGSGVNTITTGGGADTVVGTLAQLAGDTITDFSAADAVMVSGAALSGINISYGAGPASVILNGQVLMFGGAAFQGFTAAQGPSTFSFAQTAEGVKITLNAAESGTETVLYRVNAGSGGTSATNASAGSGTIAALDGGPAWLGDAALIGATGPISVLGAGTGVYTQALTNQISEIKSGNVDLSKVPWQLFVNERNDSVNDSTKLAYNFAVEAGKTYKITLYYAENWPGVFGFEDATGKTRQFDVTVEGQLLPAFTDINPIMEAVAKLGVPLPPGSASNAAKQPFLGMGFEKSAAYTATDGTLTVAFEHDIQNPKINAIQISQIVGQTPPPPAPVIAVADAAAVEGGVASVTFSRSGNLTQAVTITYLVASGTASAADYVAPASQTVTIPAGAASTSVSIAIVNDMLAEGAESFTVNVTSANTASGPATVADSSATVTIAASDNAPPATPGNAQVAFDAQNDIVKSAVYGGGEVGAAVLKVMSGNNSVAASNFGVNSFKVNNTGDKKISAIFIDVTHALYPDSVFDPDGKGGDTAFKPWAVDGAGGTGAFVSGSGYFLPGEAPIANSGGSGGASNGGFKGAMVKFNAGVSGGFQKGETVGFSGDMDPNSIAGMAKSGTAGVDTGATQGWDVGGISGHELIGSVFTVLFDDGTTASGQLMSDKSNAGSIAIATQALAPKDVSIIVNGVAAGGAGTYGVTTPSVIVSGDPGQLVRITMTRGFDPVTNETNGIDDLVEARLARYAFKVSNAFDEQSVDVTIGASGTFDASGLFTYGSASGTGKGSFTGEGVAPVAFVAATIGNIGGDFVPLGAVTAPLYLVNQGGPVTGNPVNPPSAPVISGGATATVLEGNFAALDVDATDLNGDTLSYSISSGADAGLFNIDGSTGLVSFKIAPDFEAPADAGANNVYNIAVTASDPGGLTDVQAYAISVIDDPADNPGGGGSTVRIEAENWASATSYGVESVGHASGGAVTNIAGSGGAVGTLIYALGGVVSAGAYTVTVGFLDEADGVSTVTATLGGFSGGFDMDGGVFNGPSKNNASSFSFQNVVVGASDTLELTIDTNGGEEGRVDYIEFVKTGGNPVNPPSAPVISGGATDVDATAPVVVHRWNAGTSTVDAIDGGPAWTAQTSVIKGGPTKVFAGGVATTDSSVPATTPTGIFSQERWDPATGAEMALAFGQGDLAAGGYAVRLFLANGYSGTAAPGTRVFDISIEDQIVFNDVDPTALFGHQTGGMLEWRGSVSDGTIDIGFAHGIDNPLINGVEVLALGDALLF